jgi:drug/metabolite transporter (DMT)-like permease
VKLPKDARRIEAFLVSISFFTEDSNRNQKRQGKQKMVAGNTESLASESCWRHTGPINGLMLLTTFFWASNIVAGKEALTGFSSLALAQLRMGAAATLYVLLYIAWRGFPALRLTKRQWVIVTIMALTGITLNQIFFIGGLSRTSVTHTGLIQAIGPIMVLVLSASMRIEALTSRKVLGMTISFVGVALLLIERPAKGSGANWLGDLIVVAACASFAYYTILMKKIVDRYDPLTLNALVFGLGTILLIPFCATSVVEVQWSQIPSRAWLGLAYMVLFGSFVAYLIYAFALEKLSASNVAAFAYLQPVMAALLGIWLLGEKVSIEVVFGGILILFGLYLTESAREKRKSIEHLARGRI